MLYLLSTFIIFLSKSFIITWKVTSEFLSSKNITISSKISSGIENTVFHLSHFLILTLLYSYLKSIFVNTFFFPVLSIKSKISGNR